MLELSCENATVGTNGLRSAVIMPRIVGLSDSRGNYFQSVFNANKDCRKIFPTKFSILHPK